jgi:polyhydroxyalkanoate synthesis regulator phasin
MRGPVKEIEHFTSFADTRLQNHTRELETRYQNREPVSDLKRQAYKEHQQIYQKELSDKMEELLTEKNQFLKPELSQLKDTFVAKLDIDSS